MQGIPRPIRVVQRHYPDAVVQDEMSAKALAAYSGQRAWRPLLPRAPLSCSGPGWPTALPHAPRHHGPASCKYNPSSTVPETGEPPQTTPAELNVFLMGLPLPRALIPLPCVTGGKPWADFPPNWRGPPASVRGCQSPISANPQPRRGAPFRGAQESRRDYRQMQRG